MCRSRAALHGPLQLEQLHQCCCHHHFLHEQDGLKLQLWDIGMCHWWQCWGWVGELKVEFVLGS